MLDMSGAVPRQEGVASGLGQRLGWGQKVGSPCRCSFCPDSGGSAQAGDPEHDRGGGWVRLRRAGATGTWEVWAGSGLGSGLEGSGDRGAAGQQTD